MIIRVVLLLLIASSLIYGSDKITTRIIYYIHGDGSYLFHDNIGRETKADERILREALCVAKAVNNSEVFILHHKPARNFLFLFTLKNLDFYYFKNGELKVKNTHGLQDISAIRQELDLISKYTDTDRQNTRTFFLFYGHRIPEDEGYGYNNSQPDKPFSIRILKNALLTYGTAFELIVLSTCQNGTQPSIAELDGVARFIIASPEDLSLYHISSLPFKIFIKNPLISTERFVNILSLYSFNKLKDRTFTVITISIYDMIKLNKSHYTDGVTVFYNPSRFGKFKDVKEHSGWRY